MPDIRSNTYIYLTIYPDLVNQNDESGTHPHLLMLANDHTTTHSEFVLRDSQSRVT